MMFYNIDSPIYQTYLQLIRAFPIQQEITELKPPEFKKANWLDTFGLTQNTYIVINPNASDLRLERRWGNTKYADLISKIQTQYPDVTIVLIGSPNEAEYVKQLVSKIDSLNIVDTSGKTNLTGLFEIIKNSKLVITNDSGPMHIAFAFKKMTIGLFGPCSPEQYGFHEFAIPVYKKIYCSPCVHEFDISPCNGNNQCMQFIEVEEVMNNVINVLDGNFKPNIPQSQLIFHGKDEWVPGFVNR